MTAKPKVVVLCGSTRFREEFERLASQLTLEGYIVLMPHVWIPYQDLDPGTKLALDTLHLHKIDCADEVVVVNPGYYIGASTAKGIEYAENLGKPVSYSAGEPDVTELQEERLAGSAYDLYE